MRKALWEGGKAAIAASTDPMIVYARRSTPTTGRCRSGTTSVIDAPLTAARPSSSDARFAAYGDTLYPDATFTLRISYGKVAGWTERGRQVPTRTTLGGAFERATGSEPFDLPPRPSSPTEARIDKTTPYDFVTTNDIIGGNSGSPVIDRAGTVIGAAFDGNIHSLGGNYGYDGRSTARSWSPTAAVQEALETIYPAPALVEELRAS